MTHVHNITLSRSVANLYWVFSPVISVPLFNVFLCEYEASYKTAHKTVEEPHLFSCIFKHACTHTHTLKGSLAPGQGISTKGWSWTRELSASQAGQQTKWSTGGPAMFAEI